MKRVPTGATVGINLLKFPPGFFGDEPFKTPEGRASRNRSKETSKIQQDCGKEGTGFFSGELPNILEMPKLTEINSNLKQFFPEVRVPRLREGDGII